MEITVNFDAKFHPQNHESIIAYVITDNASGRLIISSAKMITCPTPFVAEFRALNKAINFIVIKQKKDLLPGNLNIHIRGDCLGVIQLVNKSRQVKADRVVGHDFYLAYNWLCSNNKVKLEWIPRAMNMTAHTAAVDYYKSLESQLP